MGGLAHDIEAAGIATTQISLVRLHSEKIRPPRALWVSFELGRPFGPPDDAVFQRDVVHAALKLLEADDGPLLVDYPHDAPASAGEINGWSCPINFARPQETLSGSAAIEKTLRDEFHHMQPWYDRAVAARGRTTVGVSGLDTVAVATLLARLCEIPLPPSPRHDLALADIVRLAAEDAKAFYLEAAAAQPGQASAAQLRQWLWRETRLGDVLRQARETCLASDDEALRVTARALMVPRAEA